MMWVLAVVLAATVLYEVRESVLDGLREQERMYAQKKKRLDTSSAHDAS